MVIVESEQGELLSVDRKIRTVPACGYQLQDTTDNGSGKLSTLFNIPSVEDFFSVVSTAPVSSPPV